MHCITPFPHGYKKEIIGTFSGQSKSGKAIRRAKGQKFTLQSVSIASA
jgi:hypothetical protein